MRLFAVIFSMLFCTTLAFALEDIETFFNEHVRQEMIFTYVPRGLIITIHEDVFFNEYNEKIRMSSLETLNNIAKILVETNSKCIVESHTYNSNNPRYKSDWELSIVRANNIVKYLMRTGGVSPERIEAIGFGGFEPFVKNPNIQNRVDFVILHYAAKR